MMRHLRQLVPVVVGFGLVVNRSSPTNLALSGGDPPIDRRPSNIRFRNIIAKPAPPSVMMRMGTGLDHEQQRFLADSRLRRRGRRGLLLGLSLRVALALLGPVRLIGIISRVVRVLHHGSLVIRRRSGLLAHDLPPVS